MPRTSYKLANPAVNRIVCGKCETRFHTSYNACPTCSGGSISGSFKGEWLSVEREGVRIIANGGPD